MDYDCVLGMFALRCKYLKQFNYVNFNISPEVEFATFVRSNIQEDKLCCISNLSLKCCFADDLRILNV
jgi:hypothetical protein